MRLLPLFAVILTIFSCEKAELPKPFSGTPSANTVSVSMGSDYGNQLFFQLSSASVVAQNNRQIWDLGFESSENGRQIILNSSKFMALSKTGETDLAAVGTVTPTNWIYDNQKGMSDSLALSDWELNEVYIVDRGITTLGAQIGRLKFRITAFTATGVTIEWAALSSATVSSASITKDSDCNFTFFSFESGGQTVTVEPEKNSWDLCFTSYTHIYPDGVAYLVTGILSNRYLTKIAEVPVSFDAITYADASALEFSDDLDIIGYDWKVYDFGEATYIIDFNKVYVIKSVESRYYKLRFLDFYDTNGAKGTPSFELQEVVP